MSLPSLEQVDELGTLATTTVSAQYQDLNGHVSVRGHYNLHMDAAEQAFGQVLGVDETYLERTGQSSFSVAHHVLFHSEIHVGDEMSLHLRFLDRGDKTIHAVTVLTNRTTGRVASTLEFIEAYVDLTTRRATSIAPELAERIDQHVARHQALTWTLPASERLGVRR